MPTAGYSGTPLAKKLGIKSGFTIQVLNEPKPYLTFFNDFPKDVVILGEAVQKEKIDFIHVFATNLSQLEELILKAKPNLKKTGILWLSWPKKTSAIPSELNKFDVMKCGLDHGLVDTKVAAIDTDWSGHKFMYRIKDR